MSQLLVEPEVKQQIELNPSQILRQTTMTQHFGSYGYGDKVCAMGAIARYFGWDGTYNNPIKVPSKFLSNILDISIQCQVLKMNDDDHRSFIEIADYLESKGY